MRERRLPLLPLRRPRFSPRCATPSFAHDTTVAPLLHPSVSPQAQPASDPAPSTRPHNTVCRCNGAGELDVALRGVGVPPRPRPPCADPDAQPLLRRQLRRQQRQPRVSGGGCGDRLSLSLPAALASSFASRAARSGDSRTINAPTRRRPLPTRPPTLCRAPRCRTMPPRASPSVCPHDHSIDSRPYGDALTFELIPEIERRFRGLGPWARGTYGGSTGGWEALARGCCMAVCIWRLLVASHHPCFAPHEARVRTWRRRRGSAADKFSQQRGTAATPDDECLRCVRAALSKQAVQVKYPEQYVEPRPPLYSLL